MFYIVYVDSGSLRRAASDERHKLFGDDSEGDDGKISELHIVYRFIRV